MIARHPHPLPSSCILFLADRLKRNEASVKYKVLVTMKNVARSGRPEFRRSLQRHKDAVKACADFRGPPDPLKGNEPYRKVHEASKEALEAMFEAVRPPSLHHPRCYSVAIHSPTDWLIGLLGLSCSLSSLSLSLSFTPPSPSIIIIHAVGCFALLFGWLACCRPLRTHTAWLGRRRALAAGQGVTCREQAASPLQQVRS